MTAGRCCFVVGTPQREMSGLGPSPVTLRERVVRRRQKSLEESPKHRITILKSSSPARRLQFERPSFRMRTVRRSILVTLSIFVLFAGWRFVVMTQNEEMLWFVIERHAVLTLDGRIIEGWVHREWKHPFVIVTRNSSGLRESYLVAMSSNPRETYVDRCGDWIAPHFPIFPFPVATSDGLACLGWSSAWHPEQHRPIKLSVGNAGALDFIAEDGAAIRVRLK